MNISINASDIQKMLKLNKTDHVFISAKQGINLIATNKKELVIVNCDGFIEEPGEFIVDKDILKILPSVGEVTITDKEIVVGKRCINFNPEYNETPEFNYDLEEQFTMDKDIFDELIKVEYAVAKEDTRPVLTGICFNEYDVVALDGYRVAIRKNDFKFNSNILLPPELIAAYKKMKGNKVTVLRDKKITGIKVDNVTVLNESLEGDYINYRAIIPKEFTTEVKITTKEFLKLLNDYKDIGAVKLNLTDKITISGNASKYKLKDDYDCEVIGDDLEIAFNPKYLIDALKHQGEECVIKFTSDITPAILESDIETSMVLPVRIKQGDK